MIIENNNKKSRLKANTVVASDVNRELIPNQIINKALAGAPTFCVKHYKPIS